MKLVTGKDNKVLGFWLSWWDLLWLGIVFSVAVLGTKAAAYIF